jgi:aspartyl/asparaginyl beta-hydroxylase (cupin superfamily)
VHGGADKLGGEKWRAVFLNRTGRNLDEVARFFPQTMGYLQDCTRILFPIAGISFSVLEPGAYIAPHSDRTNVFIHFHQSVIAPGDCGLKVGGSDIVFEEQRSYLFDPSFVHEAWNRSSQNRVHLILPVWHPGTTAAEREALTEVFGMLRELRGH